MGAKHRLPYTVVEDEEDSRKILRDLLSTAAYDNYRWPTYMAREVAQHGEKFFKNSLHH